MSFQSALSLDRGKYIRKLVFPQAQQYISPIGRIPAKGGHMVAMNLETRFVPFSAYGMLDTQDNGGGGQTVEVSCVIDVHEYVDAMNALRSGEFGSEMTKEKAEQIVELAKHQDIGGFVFDPQTNRFKVLADLAEHNR